MEFSIGEIFLGGIVHRLNLAVTRKVVFRKVLVENVYFDNDTRSREISVFGTMGTNKKIVCHQHIKDNDPKF